jgi:hypothetical protein
VGSAQHERLGAQARLAGALRGGDRGDHLRSGFDRLARR